MSILQKIQKARERGRRMAAARWKKDRERRDALAAASIMQYPVPAGLANITVGWNDKLTAKDIEFLKTIYP